MRTMEIANGTLIQRIHGLDLPHLEFVRSTIKPMMTSEKPSKQREINMTRPTMAGSMPA